VTSNHSIYSADRLDFVPAGELRVGETLRNLDGFVRIESIEQLGSEERVYNLEIHGEHVFRVAYSGVLVHNSSGSQAPKGPLTGNADPRSLLSRQGPSAMSPGRVQEMSEEMMVGQFPWSRTGPIRVAEGPNGVRIIIDGHHRAKAAIQAGEKSVPITIERVSPERWNQLMQECLEAGGIR